MGAALQVLFCVATPALALWASERFKPAKVLGPVVLCYAAGIVSANLPGLHLSEAAGTGVAEAAVPLAIPLLLYSTELKKWLQLGPGLLISFGLACLSSVVAASIMGWTFRAASDEWWKIAGMLVGVYIGGTANMTAVGLSLGTRSETFVVLNAADVVCGGAYFLFLLSLAQRLLSKVLRPFTAEAHHEPFEHADEPLSKWTRAHAPAMAKAFGLTLLIVGLSAGLALLVLGKLDAGPVLLLITSLALAASLSPRVRSWSGAFELGEYCLLVFCVAVGSLADVSKLGGHSLVLFGFVAGVMAGASMLHFALCALFKVDVDSAIISSTAAIFGPPFIGPVAAALKNRVLVGPGLTLGLAGIALGTYLGLGTAYALRALGS
jgi:uncharacterized membrane protein